MNISELQQSFKYYAIYQKGITPKSYKAIWASLEMLCDFAEARDVKSFSTGCIENFLCRMRMERGWKAKTFRNHRQNLKSFFDWCVKRKWVKQNPVDDIEKPKLEKCLPRCLYKEDARLVLGNAACHSWGSELERSRNVAMIATMMMAGLRLQELLNLEVSDVNLAGGDILVRQGKGKKDRLVPMHPKLRDFLRSYLAVKTKWGKPSQWFFTGVKSDKKLLPKDLQRICRKISTASGVKFTPHMLRHTFARELIDNDFNLYKLKEMMGHTDVTTTQRYLAISRQGIKDSLAQTPMF